jgi:hypothetical protein
MNRLWKVASETACWTVLRRTNQNMPPAAMRMPIPT